MDLLRAKIRDVVDFPIRGITFKDITPLLRDADAFGLAIDALAVRLRGRDLTAICGIEARGFIFGSALARSLGVGFVPLRKPGKLPSAVQSLSYQLEYGAATLEIHRDALGAQDRVVLVDDLLATGGTIGASVRLVESLGAKVVACAFVVELVALKGRDKVPGEVISLVTY